MKSEKEGRRKRDVAKILEEKPAGKKGKKR
jgi:hypothetical protein